MLKMLSRGIALVAVAMLAACAGVTPNQAPSMPGPLNGYSSDPMHMIFVTSSSGHLSADQYTIVTVAANMNHAEIDLQISSPLEAESTSAGVYGLHYGVAGLMQPLAYPGALGGAAGLNGLINGVAGGGANGEHSWSYANDAGVGESTENTLRDWEADKAVPPELAAVFPNLSKLLHGVHAHIAYVRSLNKTAEPAKGLVNDWHGQQAGMPFIPDSSKH